MFGWKCQWMKSFLDESVFYLVFLMKVFFGMNLVLGRVLLRPISTLAIIFFFLGQFYSGQVRLGPILACPFDHPKCQEEKKRKKNKKKEKKKRKGGKSRRPATLSHKHSLCPPFGFQQAFNVEHSGPKAGDVPHQKMAKIGKNKNLA